MALTRSLLSLALAATVALAATGEAPTSRAAGGCARGADWPAPEAALAAGVVRLVNAHRRALHLSTLTSSAALGRSAPVEGQPEWPAIGTCATRTPVHP